MHQYDPRFKPEYVQEPEDLDRLNKQGLIDFLCLQRQDKIELFNAWRMLHWHPIDLAGALFSRITLAGINFQEVDLANSNFAHTDLTDANLQFADLTHAHMPHVYLPGADLQSAQVVEAHLFRANLRGAILINTNFTGSNLHAADLTEAHLRGANLRDASLPTAKLKRASLRQVNLTNADLADADLSEANLTNAILERANLSGVNLEGANLQFAALRDVFLARTLSLRGVRLHHANLWGAMSLNHEQFMEESGESTIWEEANQHYGEAVAVYKSLKGYFEDAGDYEAANWAFEREQQMKKLMHVPRWCKWLYPMMRGTSKEHLERHCRANMWKWLRLEVADQVAGYGLSLVRPLMWLGAVILGFAMLYWLGGMLTTHPGCAYSERMMTPRGDCAPSATIADALVYSLASIASMEIGTVRPYLGYVALLSSLEALMGIALTGLFGFVLGNRLRNP